MTSTTKKGSATSSASEAVTTSKSRFTMVSATVVFAVAWLLQRPGYVHGTVKPGGWIVAVAAELLLAAGGYMGGTIVFVYGHRVVNRPRTAVRSALTPAAPPPSDPSDGAQRIDSAEARSMQTQTQERSTNG